MRKADVNLFFREAAKSIQLPVKIYLTGAVASWFWGGRRPTNDIDFGIAVDKRHFAAVGEVFETVSRSLGLPIQFAEDLSRWSLITFPDYEKKAKFYKRFGMLRVYRLDPATWSVGKLARNYASDVEDLVAVLKAQPVRPEALVRTWSKALRDSPRSSAQFVFGKSVENFLRQHGPRIWGKNFAAEPLIQRFYAAVRRSPKSSSSR